MDKKMTRDILIDPTLPLECHVLFEWPLITPTDRFMALEKLNLLLVVWFFTTAPSSSKNDTRFKSG